MTMNKTFLKATDFFKSFFGNSKRTVSKNTSIDTTELCKILADPARLRDFREFLLPMRVPDMEVDIDLFLQINYVETTKPFSSNRRSSLEDIRGHLTSQERPLWLSTVELMTAKSRVTNLLSEKTSSLGPLKTLRDKCLDRLVPVLEVFRRYQLKDPLFWKEDPLQLLVAN